MISGERVRLAREFRGLTQAHLASRAGVTQSAIAQIEIHKIQQPFDTVVDGIAMATGFPPSFFRQGPPAEFPEGSLLYRARADLAARARTAVHRGAQLVFE